MSISVETPFEELVSWLLKKAVIAIEEGKNDGHLKPQKIKYFKWRLNDFKYTENGAHYASAKGDHFEKEDWSQAQSNIYSYLCSLDVFIALDAKIKNQFTEYDSQKLISFLDLFLLKYFKGEIKESDVDSITKSFIKDLHSEPFECGAEVGILGVALEIPFIDLRNGITLRQTQKNDLEIEIPEYLINHQGLDHNYPSLIMKITTLGRTAADVQQKIWDAEAILRLFKVGSIRHKNYEFYSKSFSTQLRGRGGSLDTTQPANIGFIKKNEIERLRKFWDFMQEKVIVFTRLGPKTTFRHIAYQRYQDAILPRQENFERRVADCMMGLESIFLRDGGEQQELAYRLRMRVSRVMGKIGFDAFKIKRMIRDAYEVRSRFVHGGTLDHDGTTRLEEKHESLSKFLLQLLDILRISIVVTLIMDIEKPKFIDLIDGSFLEKKYEVELEQILSNTRQIF